MHRVTIPLLAPTSPARARVEAHTLALKNTNRVYMCVFAVNTKAFQHTFVPFCETAAHCVFVFLLFAIILSAAASAAYSARRTLCSYHSAARHPLQAFPCQRCLASLLSLLLLLFLFSYLSLHSIRLLHLYAFLSLSSSFRLNSTIFGLL